MALNARALFVRTGPVFGGPAWSEDRILTAATGALDPKTLVSPSFLQDLVHAALDLLIDGERGL